MKIQIITGNKGYTSDDTLFVSDYAHSMSPDDFDINIIDLSYQGIWRNNGNEIGHIEIYDDLTYISKMLTDSHKCKIVYVFPQDGDYFYCHDGKSFRRKERIKDLIVGHYDLGYEKCFSLLSPCADLCLEPTKTKIDNTEYSSDFRFSFDFGTVVTKSEKSEKTTTLRYDERFFYTSLDIFSSVEKLMVFVNKCLVDPQSETPGWIGDYDFFNDQEMKTVIESSNNKIEELKKQIEKAQYELNQNNRYKTILFSNGDQLVQVVFEILERLFEYDLSEFIDKKKEDFLIDKGNAIFIGEIKGVTTNVKNEHISQLDVHYQTFCENQNNESIRNMVHALLIINPFRTKSLNDREPIHEGQIALAKRNASVIIETVTLLKMFELHQAEKLTTDEIIDKLSQIKGLLRIEDLVTEK